VPSKSLRQISPFVAASKRVTLQSQHTKETGTKLQIFSQKHQIKN